MQSRPEQPNPKPVDVEWEGGDPPCWAHLFEDDVVVEPVDRPGEREYPDGSGPQQPTPRAADSTASTPPPLTEY